MKRILTAAMALGFLAACSNDDVAIDTTADDIVETEEPLTADITDDSTTSLGTGDAIGEPGEAVAPAYDDGSAADTGAN